MSTGQVPVPSVVPAIRGAHLVGSVNLPDAGAVFGAVSEHLGDRLRRIQDGPSERTVGLLDLHAAVAEAW